jgi:hypothetical protein
MADELTTSQNDSIPKQAKIEFGRLLLARQYWPQKGLTDEQILSMFIPVEQLEKDLQKRFDNDISLNNVNGLKKT